MEIEGPESFLAISSCITGDATLESYSGSDQENPGKLLLVDNTGYGLSWLLQSKWSTLVRSLLSLLPSGQ